MGFQGFLKQSTAVDVLIGPFVDSTDGDTEETGLTIAQADVRLSKNGQTGAQKSDVTTCAHDADGFYNCELDATDTDTVGQLTLYVHVAGALAVRHDYHVIEEAIYDALYGASAAGYDANQRVDVGAILGTAQTAGDVYGVLGADIAAETHDANLHDQLRKIVTVIESQRGAHTHHATGAVFHVDPVNGDTHANGNRGGIADPYLGFQDCHDNGAVDSRHDIINLVPGSAAGVTTLTEDVTISKRYLFIRGPGRDFVWTRSGAGDTISVTADGVELSGFQLETAATGSGAGIMATDSDFLKAHHIWVNATQGDGIQLLRGSNAQVHNCVFQLTGQGGSGQGIQINGSGGSADNNHIFDCSFEDCAGDAVNIQSGTSTNTRILNNTIHGCSGWGIDITASSTDAFVADNRLGNNTSGDIQDNGTTSIVLNNEQWGTSAALATVDTVVDAIEVDTQDIQTRLPAALVSGKMDSDATAINSSTAAAIRLALSAGQIIPGTVDNTAFTATSSIFESDDITEATADHYGGTTGNERVILWTTGALTGQVAEISDYELTAGRGRFTVGTAMTEAPADNDTFLII